MIFSGVFIKTMTRHEYEKRLADIYREATAEIQQGKAADKLSEKYEKMEFDLTIEYKLGASFPIEKRDHMWQIRRESFNQREKLRKSYEDGSIAASQYQKELQRLIRLELEAYRQILSPGEYRRYFGSRLPERVSIPLDVNKIT